MPIKVTCLECSRVYQLPDAAAGRKGKCECGAVLDIPVDVPQIETHGSGDDPDDDGDDIVPVPHVTPPPLPVLDDFASSDNLPPSPPPPPPTFDSSEWGGSEGPSHPVVVDVRYQDLRKCSQSIRVIGKVIFGFSILTSACLVLTSIVWAVEMSSHANRMQGFGQREIANEMTTTIGAVVLANWGAAAASALGGYVANLLCRTLSHALYVLMDNEENTRRTSLIVEQLQH